MDTEGYFQKVQCKSIAGGSIDDVAIDTFIGEDELTDDLVTADFNDNGADKDSLFSAEKLDSTMGEAYKPTSYDEDYEQEVHGDNRYISCVAMIEIPKIDRDYGIFGEYDVKLGTRVFTSMSDTEFTSLGDFSTTYYLEEPEYHVDETAAEEELSYVYIDHKEWSIDVEEIFND
jgi:hypothetical protein